MATDKVETTSLGDANKRYVMGLKDLSGSFTAFWDRLDDVLFDCADSPTRLLPGDLSVRDVSARAGKGRRGWMPRSKAA